MSNYILISIIIVVCLYFIIKMIDTSLLIKISALQELIQLKEHKEDAFWKILKHIQNELRLTQLKECPIEELKQIPKELIDWIDELERETQKICQEVKEK